MPTPDTSPKAVASVIRGLLAQIDRMAPTLEEYDYTPEECQGRALADALEQTPDSGSFRGALTQDDWDARIMRALSVPIGDPYRITKAIHVAFPELAPTDDPTETCANCHIAYPVAEVHCTAEGRFLCDGCADD